MTIEMEQDQPDEMLDNGGDEGVKPQSAKFTLLDVASPEGQWIDSEIRNLRANHHEHLVAAVIAVLWKNNWSGDVDGKAPLAQLKVVPEEWYRLINSAADGAVSPPDFILLLNSKTWHPLANIDKTFALDMALCYGAPKEAKDGTHAEDETGRMLHRLLKPDFAGFAGPIERHGARLKSVKRFMRAATSGAQLQLSLEEPDEEDAPMPEEGERPGAEFRIETSQPYYHRVDDLYSLGDSYAIRFSMPNHSADCVTGISGQLEPDEDVEMDSLTYSDDQMTLRRCKIAYENLLDIKYAKTLAGAEPALTSANP